MVGTVPLEEHLAGGNVYLLDDAIDHRLVGWTPDGSQIGRRRVIGSDQRGVLRGDQELVPVGCITVAGIDGGDLLVVAVVDVVGSIGQAAKVRALPPRQDQLPVVGLGPEVRGSLLGRDGMEPDDLPTAADDLGPVGVGAAVTGGRDEVVPAATTTRWLVSNKGFNVPGGRTAAVERAFRTRVEAPEMSRMRPTRRA
jgi:hypothetical protein